MSNICNEIRNKIPFDPQNVNEDELSTTRRPALCQDGCGKKQKNSRDSDVSENKSTPKQ
jgi:hypothetical protein